MKRSPLLTRRPEPSLADPFTKKGGLALFWLLGRRGLGHSGDAQEFSINQLARDLGVMPFTVHRVIQALEYDGIIRSQGMSTKKRFHLAEPKALLIRWLKRYQFRKKNKLRQYALSDPKAFHSKKERLLASSAVPALHTAARLVFQAGMTNLETTEAYVLDPKTVSSIEREYGLVEQERGYEVLLIEPYYRGVVERYSKDRDDPLWRQAFALLNFLDLYFFPIRGREQAEILFRKIPALKSLGSWPEFEAIDEI